MVIKEDLSKAILEMGERLEKSQNETSEQIKILPERDLA